MGEAPTVQRPPTAGTPQAWQQPGGTPPSMSYPSVSAGQAQGAATYAPQPAAVPQQGGFPGAPPPGAIAYPAPGESGNNRAVWIIVAVVAALLVICLLLCVLLLLIGAIGANAASSGFATAVPTITR